MIEGMKRALRYVKRHPKDDNRAYFAGISATLFLVVILGTFGMSLASYIAIRAGGLASVIASVLVDLTNSDRQKLALNGLTVNPLLVEAARLKAEDMVAHGYFAHVSPEGKDSWHWFQEAGYVFSDAGENLAMDFSDSWDVENAWMNSPSHRANIVNNNYTEIGIAIANGTYNGRQTTFVVQMFGTPARQQKVQQPVHTEIIPREPTMPSSARVEVPEPTVLGESTDDPGPVVPEEPTPSDTSVVVEPMHHEVAPPRAEDVAAPVVASAINHATWYERVLASPKTVLLYTYTVLALIILGSLLMTLRYELQQHHTRHALAAVLLIIIMGGILYMTNVALFVSPTLAVPSMGMSA